MSDAGDDETFDKTRRALLAVLPFLAFADSAEAQDPVQVQPTSYRVAFENDHLRVLDYSSRPGMGVCGNGMHSHPAHLTVVMSNSDVRIRTPDGKVVVRSDIPAGTVFWSEAETHEVENLSGADVRSLLIELKGVKA